MKIRFLKARHWMILALLGMLGFSACERDNIRVMYGAPVEDYNDSIVNKP